ncbi:MAG: hypothetical protein ABIP14_16885 [Blastocatellia bacterium]
MTLKVSNARPFLFPGNRSQVDVGINAARANVKGAEGIVFQRLLVRRFAFNSQAPGSSSIQKSGFDPKIHSPYYICASAKHISKI